MINKLMKKTIYILALACGFSSIALGQQSLWTLNYEISVPTGDTRDYISKTSFRGASFEGRGFVSDVVSVGGWISWEVFKERLDGATFQGNGVDVTGTQVRYLNMMPVLVTSHYYFGDFSGVTPYAGGGVGAYRSLQRTEIGLVALSNDNWHVGFAPEVGVFLPVNYSSGVNLSVKYNYAAESNGSSYSYVSFNIGIAWLDF